MRTKASPITRILVGVVCAVATLVFGLTAVRAFEAPHEEELPIEQVAQVLPVVHGTSSAGSATLNTEGMRLRIPSAEVDAAITSVGVGVSGNMAVPRSYSEVGLYRYGPRPGEVGSAVIDGHLDNGFGLPAVFRKLEVLKKGDFIYVDSADGRSLRFIVTEVASYDIDAVPLPLIFNRRDGNYLNLITCDGTWSSEEMGYDKRLVVFSMLAGEGQSL